MALHPAGTPILRTTTSETDPDTDARSIVDINNLALPARGASEKDLAKWRRDVLKYVGSQLDMLVSGQAERFEIEVGKA